MYAPVVSSVLKQPVCYKETAVGCGLSAVYLVPAAHVDAVMTRLTFLVRVCL